MSYSTSILMSTFNGEKYLAEQLQSIEDQTDDNWIVAASDDGSTDLTLEILKYFQSRWGKDRLTIYAGPQAGFAANFMSLIGNKSVRSDYFAFSDQDDIWHPDKLKRGINSIANIGETKPALYCSRTELVDADGSICGKSVLFAGQKNFKNALVQSIAGGNTMIFNTCSRDLLASLADKTQKIVSHDWMMYQLVSGADGHIEYDSWESVKYRQHGANLVGSNSGLVAKLHRGLQFAGGRYRRWNDMNVAALECLNGELSHYARADLKEFIELRDGAATRQIKHLIKPKFKRQTKASTLALSIGLMLGLV